MLTVLSLTRRLLDARTGQHDSCRRASINIPEGGGEARERAGTVHVTIIATALPCTRSPKFIEREIMNPQKSFAAFLLIALLMVATAFAQKTLTGSIKGKVRGENGAGVSGVAVIVRRGEREITRVETDRRGDFNIAGLEPGFYGMTFRKAGLSVGAIEDVEVRAGKTRELRDGLILKVDEGSIAFLRGSVFNEDGRSVSNARVEIARVAADGTVKKFDSRITSETGSFVFRLAPDTATYRLTVKAGNSQPVSKDVQIDGPAVYRVALSLASSTR